MLRAKSVGKIQASKTKPKLAHFRKTDTTTKTSSSIQKIGSPATGVADKPTQPPKTRGRAPKINQPNNHPKYETTPHGQKASQPIKMAITIKHTIKFSNNLCPPRHPLAWCRGTEYYQMLLRLPGRNSGFAQSVVGVPFTVSGIWREE